MSSPTRPRSASGQPRPPPQGRRLKAAASRPPPQGRRHPRRTAASLAGPPPAGPPPPLPAAGPPLGRVRALRAEHRVVPVARVDPGAVRQLGEHPLLQVVHELGEPLWVPLGVPRAAGEE